AGEHPSGGVLLGPGDTLYGTTAGDPSDSTPRQTVWESVNNAGTFAAPTAIATIPANPGTFPDTAVVTDGTNVFGVTTTNSPMTPGGIIFGVGPAEIPHG